MKRRDFLKTMSAGAAAATLPASLFYANDAGARRPNIVLIMADDMGFSDLGSYGGEIDTPNLDHLAAGGMRFTQFYNNAKCGPTRASLHSGLYAQQVGGHEFEGAATIAEVLKAAGYRTLMTGKWHMSGLPTQRGFDRYYGLADGCCNYFNPGTKRPGEPTPAHKPSPFFPRRWAIDGEVYRPYTPKDPDFYTTDAFTDYAISYLDRYRAEEKPFFLYVAYTAPHYPLHARPEDIARYKGTYMMGWDEMRRRRYARQLEAGLIDEQWELSPRDDRVPKWTNTEERQQWAFEELREGALGKMTWEEVDEAEEWAHKMAVYAAMVDRMDQNIGRILRKIQALGEEENTLVLFLSDNGGCEERIYITPEVPAGAIDSYRSVDPPWANASNTPFRKYKTWAREGGIATPLIAHWPGVVEPGSLTHQVGHVIDLMATCADVARAEYPPRHKTGKVPPMEGKSLRPILKGRQRSGHEMLGWKYRGSRALRQGRWKLVTRGKRPWSLYDMEADRTELNDLSEKRPAKVRRLAKLWQAWAERTSAP